VLDPQLSSKRRAPKVRRDCELSTRELEILQLLVDGKSNKEIAAHLRLSANTVGAHRANIMATLGIHKTADLVVYAIRKRLVSIP
jgi:DNA-binding NarL/FixJ family response regulator